MEESLSYKLESRINEPGNCPMIIHEPLRHSCLDYELYNLRLNKHIIIYLREDEILKNKLKRINSCQIKKTPRPVLRDTNRCQTAKQANRSGIYNKILKNLRFFLMLS